MSVTKSYTVEFRVHVRPGNRSLTVRDMRDLLAAAEASDVPDGTPIISGGGTYLTSLGFKARSRTGKATEVAEQALGRQLRDTEMIHHVNGDASDNRPENIQIRTAVA